MIAGYDDIDVLVNVFMPGTIVYIDNEMNMIGNELHEGYIEEWGE